MGETWSACIAAVELERDSKRGLTALLTEAR